MAQPQAQIRFERVMAEVFRHEGGFVNHPRDPGGATNMGITIGTLAEWRGRPVTVDDVRQLSRKEAMAIYRAKYWDRVAGDDLPAGQDYVAMDGAVNSGVSRGARWLQTALNRVGGQDIPQDGAIGPLTLRAAMAAVRDGRGPAVVQDACAQRLAFKRGLRIWDTFGRGWSRRVAEVEAKAVRWAAEANGQSARLALIAEADKASIARARAQGEAAGFGVGIPSSTIVADALIDVPSWGVFGAIVVCVLVVLASLRRSMEQDARSTAYTNEAVRSDP